MLTFADRIHALNIDLLEMVISVPLEDNNAYEMHRFVISNNSGVLWRIDASIEHHTLRLGVPSPQVGCQCFLKFARSYGQCLMVAPHRLCVLSISAPNDDC